MCAAAVPSCVWWRSCEEAARKLGTRRGSGADTAQSAGQDATASSPAMAASTQLDGRVERLVPAPATAGAQRRIYRLLTGACFVYIRGIHHTLPRTCFQGRCVTAGGSPGSRLLHFFKSLSALVSPRSCAHHRSMAMPHAI